MKRDYSKITKPSVTTNEDTQLTSEKATKQINLKLEPKEEIRTMVVTNCSRLNVRDQPNKYGHAFYVLNAGDVVSVKEIQNGWASITSGTDIEGYVMEEYLKEG